jgi:hypothetical protein
MAMTIRTLMLAGVAGATILATVPFSPFAAMAQNTYAVPDQGQSGDNQPQQMRKPKQGQTSDDQSTREMRKQRAEGEQGDERDSADMKREGRREGRLAYDRGRHGERMRHREGRYRYFHDGYYYATPWWTTGIVVGGGGGISCREGARIASRRGFNRVVPVDCGGETFTYRGWRGGDPWRVRIDSDSGRIVAVRPAG